jgi:hypothetical protein
MRSLEADIINSRVGVSKVRFTVIARSKTEAIQLINDNLWIASCFIPRSRNDGEMCF